LKLAVFYKATGYIHHSATNNIGTILNYYLYSLLEKLCNITAYLKNQLVTTIQVVANVLIRLSPEDSSFARFLAKSGAQVIQMCPKHCHMMPFG
jgi:hypothetical protein